MYLSKEQLNSIGFDYIGDDCKISDKAIFYRPGKISIGSNVTIKDMCIISGGDNGIEIHKNVTIEPYSSIRGIGHIEIRTGVIISSNVAILSSSDDYNNIDPVSVYFDKIIINHYARIGHGSLILHGSHIGEWASLGAMSMIKNCVIPDREIWAGVPAKKIRSKK